MFVPGRLIVQMLAGRGCGAVTVAIDPAPFRGVLPLPLSSLKAGSPVLGNPLNRHRAVPLSYEHFRYSFANAIDEEEAQQLYEEFAVAAPGAPLFQAAAANLTPLTEVKVDSGAEDRGPMLIISGEKDHTIPWALANAAFKRQERNEAVTEITEIPDRGHALTIDSGWRDVAETALTFACGTSGAVALSDRLARIRLCSRACARRRIRCDGADRGLAVLRANGRESSPFTRSRRRVRQVNDGDRVVIANARPRRTGSLLMIGPTHGGRILTVVLNPEPAHSGAWHVRTAWDASTAQLRRYRRDR